MREGMQQSEDGNNLGWVCRDGGGVVSNIGDT